MDPGLNQLLKWGVTNSSSSTSPQQNGTTNGDSSPTTAATATPIPAPNAEALQALFGDSGPSDAELMRAALSSIEDTTTPLAEKLIAFDNLEQLLENLDNANDLPALGLWEPLLTQLSNTEPELRRMACWCVGTSVQNNVKAQKEAFDRGAVEKVTEMLVGGETDRQVKRKAVYALSSLVRNFPPATAKMVELLPSEVLADGDGAQGDVDASDMDRLDRIMVKLRDDGTG
ncbi:MAG: hypothetical protein M1825_003082 [Sarcosagium campestre]|nr:MAG: hypothetical protein M1825_003082 [Sarcosagium campestre]